jgi:hypothetical protein
MDCYFLVFTAVCLQVRGVLHWFWSAHFLGFTLRNRFFNFSNFNISNFTLPKHWVLTPTDFVYLAVWSAFASAKMMFFVENIVCRVEYRRLDCCVIESSSQLIIIDLSNVSENSWRGLTASLCPVALLVEQSSLRSLSLLCVRGEELDLSCLQIKFVSW